MSLNFIPVYLLKKSLTTPEDLRKIANSLNFNIDYIGFGYNFPEIKDSSKLCILNLGNDLIGGTHWLAVNNESKEFFDPIGAPPPNYIPKDYKNNNNNGIQDIKYGRCGQYCCLFLYYSNKGKSKDFFKIFSNSMTGGLVTSGVRLRKSIIRNFLTDLQDKKLENIKNLFLKQSSENILKNKSFELTPEQKEYQEKKIEEARKGLTQELYQPKDVETDKFTPIPEEYYTNTVSKGPFKVSRRMKKYLKRQNKVLPSI